MRQFLEPHLVNDVFGDPVLHIDLRDERRALLLDLGDISPLPPRKLIRVSHVFVTHTHMDHFAGFDAMLRVLLGRKSRLDLWGGPGFVDQVEHKLHAYTWNVVHRYEVELALHVHALGTDGAVQHARFSSRSAFRRKDLPPTRLQGDVLSDEWLFRVRGRFVDHEMPCLALAVEEKARVKVAKDRLAALGIATGAWLRELKRAVLTDAAPDTPLRLQWRDRTGEHDTVRRVGELRDVVLDISPGQRIGYVTDLRDTEANRQTLRKLMTGVDQLFIEAVFLDADGEHAARKNHLTAGQAGRIARELQARAVTPFHFSPRYEGRAERVRQQVFAAWRGDAG
jgi:ribonuclease Z